MVPLAGLEPARLAAVDFESTVSAIPPEGHVGARGGTRTRRTLILSQVRLPITSLAQICLLLYLVPRAGLEPARPFNWALGPQPSVSTHSTTEA